MAGGELVSPFGAVMQIDENIWAIVLIVFGAFVCTWAVHVADEKLFALGETIAGAGMIAFKGNTKPPSLPAGPAKQE